MKIVARVGFFSSFIGCLFLVLMGFILVALDGFMDTPKDPGIWAKAAVPWIAALVGFWGGWQIFSAPRTSLAVMLLLILFLFPLGLVLNVLAIPAVFLTLGSFALTAGLAYLCSRRKTETITPKN